ncbi:hypothetical protein WJX73_006600 [Symbiochloris irregularis]|uniref:Uncharacterized protein n=1 Tax=Symbiochloris irregularis TaxID=706552 RepID=A0AAW1P512_9CHLO
MVGEVTAILEFNGRRELDLQTPAGRVTDNVQRLKAEVIQVINSHLQSTGQGAAVQAEDVNLDEEDLSEEEDKPAQTKKKRKRGK